LDLYAGTAASAIALMNWSVQSQEQPQWWGAEKDIQLWMSAQARLVQTWYRLTAVQGISINFFY
jgi:hypothetical protein